MKLISFDALRTYNMSSAHYIKPENLFKEKEKVKEADWILFPKYWQINTLVYGLKKNIFPNISTYHLGHNKVEMTRAFMAVCPENTPYTEILSNTPNNQELILDTFSFPFIAKEIKNSMGNGVFLIQNPKEFKNYCRQNDVLYVQEKLPINRDIRITYVGDEIVGAYWRIGSENNFKNNVAQGGTISYDNISADALLLVESIAKTLGINHAGFDVAEVDGHYYILEFNVFFGTRGLLDMGVNLSEIILKYLKSHPSNIPTDPIFPFPRIS
jgi:ribosomal protein S6--L-glutamate ligase